MTNTPAHAGSSSRPGNQAIAPGLGPAHRETVASTRCESALISQWHIHATPAVPCHRVTAERHGLSGVHRDGGADIGEGTVPQNVLYSELGYTPPFHDLAVLPGPWPPGKARRPGSWCGRGFSRKSLASPRASPCDAQPAGNGSWAELPRR